MVNYTVCARVCVGVSVCVCVNRWTDLNKDACCLDRLCH